jgi:hypothetical protein
MSSCLTRYANLDFPDIRSCIFRSPGHFYAPKQHQSIFSYPLERNRRTAEQERELLTLQSNLTFQSLLT